MSEREVECAVEGSAAVEGQGGRGVCVWGVGGWVVRQVAAEWAAGKADGEIQGRHRGRKERWGGEMEENEGWHLAGEEGAGVVAARGRRVQSQGAPLRPQGLQLLRTV